MRAPTSISPSLRRAAQGAWAKVVGVVGLTALLATAAPARACTNLLVSRGATSDGSTLITYTADSHALYGTLVHTPGAVHLPDATREIIEWDTGRRLGTIPQAPRTYTVVGNMNEHQLAIGETTFGGRVELVNPQGVLDYGSLMWIALERARTAREAVTVITSLAERHGYASSGESISISDPREVWLLEIVGAGKGSKGGAIWVARRVPDGYISAHANQARIRTFPRNDPGTLYSKNVVSFARTKGWFKGADRDFSFADAYGPLTWGSLRTCEARVWSIFRRVSRGAGKYLAWIKGQPGATPLPLWIKPDRKLAVRDGMELMRDTFQGTDLDLARDIGAGPYELPYRWRPLFWYADAACDACAKEKKEPRERRTCLAAKRCVQYLNERSIATQQTGFSFVAQARGGLPAPIGGVLWFGVDDTNSTVYVPLYAGIQRAPRPFAVGTGDFKTFSWDSAFWVFNLVANFAYSRYRDMIVDIRRAQRELEGSFLARQPEIERHALVLYKQSPERAREYLTRYSAEQARRTLERWRLLLPELLLKYLDGNVRDEHGKPTHPGYPKGWYQRLIKERGEHLRVRKLQDELPEELLR